MFITMIVCIDLVISLFSPKTKNEYFGSNRLNRNTLDLINIPADNYTLSIYEPIPNVLAAVGCSEFTFSIYVEEYTTCIHFINFTVLNRMYRRQHIYIAEEQYIVEYHFPSNLNTIPYLNASSKVHLANNYFMFDGSGLHQNTTFTIYEVFYFCYYVLKYILIVL